MLKSILIHSSHYLNINQPIKTWAYEILESKNTKQLKSNLEEITLPQVCLEIQIHFQSPKSTQIQSHLPILSHYNPKPMIKIELGTMVHKKTYQ